MADCSFVEGKTLRLHGRDTEFYHYWDFGDGIPISNASNPSHIYSSLGTYTVSHWAQSPCGTCTISIHTVEVVSSLPYSGTADFGFQLGEEIYFNRKDTEFNHYWDFGDGTSISTLPSPEHIYTSPGTYTITHTAQSVCGICTAIIKTVDILPSAVCAGPVCKKCYIMKMLYNDKERNKYGTK